MVFSGREGKVDKCEFEVDVELIYDDCADLRQCNPDFNCNQPYNKSNISETTPQCGGCPHTKCASCAELKDEGQHMRSFTSHPADDIWVCVGQFLSLSTECCSECVVSMWRIILGRP